MPARFTQVASQAVLFDRLGGLELASEMIRRRAGSVLDPSIADTFLRHGRELLAEITSSDASIAVIETEPEPRRRIAELRLDEVARAFADLVDLKSPFMHGHSVAVSQLTETAAANLGLTEDEVVCVRRAGLLHNLGRAGVPNGIWDKPGPLTATEWEQVRLHPYHSERILSRAAVIDAIGETVDLLGWSYGAFPVPEGTELYPPEALDSIRSSLKAGDREEALTTFYRDIALISPEEIEMLRSLPVWPARVALAPTIPHERRAFESYVSDFDPGDWAI